MVKNAPGFPPLVGHCSRVNDRTVSKAPRGAKCSERTSNVSDAGAGG